MHLLLIVILFPFFICISYSVYNQNLIKNPCLFPNYKKQEYKVVIDEKNNLQFITDKCVYFVMRPGDSLNIDTSSYIIDGWKEFSTHKENRNITKYNNDWFICQEKISVDFSDSCFIIEYSPYNVWANEKIFLGGSLIEPLICEKSYKFSFRIKKVCDSPFSVKEMSVLFSEEKDSLNFFLEKQQVPTQADIVFTLNNDTNWQYCEKYFTANGHEKYFYLGIMKEQVNKIGFQKNNASELYFKYLFKKKLKDKDKQLYIKGLNDIYSEVFYIDYSNFEKFGMNIDYIIYWLKDFKITETME